MGRERRRRDQRGAAQNRSRRQNPQGHNTYQPAGPVEFPGVMGWLQRRTKVIVVSGILFLVVSLGAGSLFATNPPGSSAPDPSPVPTDTPAPTPDPNDEPEDDINRIYDAPPEMMIDADAEYEAVIHLAGGDEVRLELYPDEAPEYVNNFVFLSLNRFYDGLTFHRVEPGFVAQAGDPTGDGAGGPGYMLDEEDNSLLFEEGVLAMATSQMGVSGSQFFITMDATPWLQDDFTVFGRLVDGMDHVHSLTARTPGAPDQPDGDEIDRIQILENGSEMESPEDEDEDEDEVEADDAEATEDDS